MKGEWGGNEGKVEKVQSGGGKSGEGVRGRREE